MKIRKIHAIYLPFLSTLVMVNFSFAEESKPVPVDLPITVTEVSFPLKLEGAESLAEACYNNSVSKDYWFSVTPKNEAKLFRSSSDIKDFCTKGEQIYQFTFMDTNGGIIAVVYINPNNVKILKGFGPWKEE